MSIQRVRSSSSSRSWKYDVFINFEGEGTGKNFTDHLYAALDRERFKVYKSDKEIERGTPVSPDLVRKAIEESRISIVVFSKSYVSSTRCLDELVKIIECKKPVGQMIFPIFYDVEPSVLRRQINDLQETFAEQERTFKENLEELQMWRNALKEAASLSGFHLMDGYESELIEDVVKEVGTTLSSSGSRLSSGLLLRLGQLMHNFAQMFLLDSKPAGTKVELMESPTDQTSKPRNRALKWVKARSSFQNIVSKNTVERFPSSIATNILMKLGNYSFMEIPLSSTINKKIREAIAILNVLTGPAFLTAEALQAQNCKLQIGLGKLSELLYDAEDLFDELNCEVLAKQVSKLSAFIYCGKIKDISKKLDEMAATIISIYDENKVEVGLIYSEEEMPIKQTFVGTSDVFGRDVDKEKIINFLKQPNNEGEKVSVIPIVGGGGIGKTTLAKLVYSDKMIDKHFDLKMWVRAPEDFEILTLMTETYASATGQYQAGLAVRELEARLLKELDGKKFLLVLDDVWNQNYGRWDRFRKLLTQNPNGSKIVVTTRSNRVAKLMCTVDKYVLKGLSQEDSMLLFEKSAASKDEHNTDEDLIKIGDEIVKKCGGNPLAVKTLGTLLHQNREKADWLLIKDNEIWNQGEEEKDVLLALKLSYAHLPSHLRRCLAYCSLFPKGYRFNSNYLVCHWMAQGFLATHNENEELEDVGLQYLKELTWRCFFQDVEYHGYFFTFQMHDFVHDLVLKVAQTECELLDLSFPETKRNGRHLSFIDFHYSDQEVPFISKKLRTIIMQSIVSERVKTAFLNTWISSFKYLRLLCFSGLQFKVLPVSIGALKHLRCLELCWNLMLKEIPEHISNLVNLQTLRLLGCSNLQKLPHNMQKMTSLRYLEITTKEIGEWMQSFTSLRTLVLQGCDSLNSLPDNIKNLKRLEKLVIYSCPEINLMMDLQSGDSNYWINTLEYLWIEACPKLKKLPPWLASLKALQKLEILSCPELSSLPDGMQNLTNLRELKIRNCPTLSKSCWNNLRNISHVSEIQLDPLCFIDELNNE